MALLRLERGQQQRVSLLLFRFQCVCLFPVFHFPQKTLLMFRITTLCWKDKSSSR